MKLRARLCSMAWASTRCTARWRTWAGPCTSNHWARQSPSSTASAWRQSVPLSTPHASSSAKTRFFALQTRSRRASSARRAGVRPTLWRGCSTGTWRRASCTMHFSHQSNSRWTKRWTVSARRWSCASRRWRSVSLAIGRYRRPSHLPRRRPSSVSSRSARRRWRRCARSSSRPKRAPSATRRAHRRSRRSATASPPRPPPWVPTRARSAPRVLAYSAGRSARAGWGCSGRGRRAGRRLTSTLSLRASRTSTTLRSSTTMIASTRSA
mmetsp:Transcript_17352/g.44419  ORF Transcript_17352/g.44419 Transcript_17352/m.44419 type:complete len:267 (-) Transcript_17352:2089-2889(-)